MPGEKEERSEEIVISKEEERREVITKIKKGTNKTEEKGTPEKNIKIK